MYPVIEMGLQICKKIMGNENSIILLFLTNHAMLSEKSYYVWHIVVLHTSISNKLEV